MAEKKSWRDFYKVHPAADVFPMLPEDEIRKLGDDIKENGLRDPVVIWSSGNRLETTQQYILDGRNRLDAMELVGIEILDDDTLIGFDGRRFITLHLYEYIVLGKDNVAPGVTDPVSYVISKNIHRRHLTKEQRAELIVKAVHAGADFAKLARSVKRDSSGHVQGSVKDPIKEKAIEEASKLGISKRTIERSIAKAKGPVLHKTMATPKPIARSIEDIVRKVMAFVDRNLADQSHESLSLLSEQLTAAIQHRMHGAPRKLSRPELNGEWETIDR